MLRQRIAKLLFLAIPQLLFSFFYDYCSTPISFAAKRIWYYSTEIGFLTTSIFAGFRLALF